MKAKEIEVGGRYCARVGGILTILYVQSYRCWNRSADDKMYREWTCINQATGRTVKVHSAQRFRRRIKTGVDFAAVLAAAST